MYNTIRFSDKLFYGGNNHEKRFNHSTKDTQIE